MFTPVQGVAAAAPVTGLVAAAVRPTIDRWEQGVAWIPERCGTRYRLVPWCDEPESGYEPNRPGTVHARPVGVQWAEECTTLSGEPDMERIRRSVEAQTPFVVARELWTGEGTQADPFTVDGAARTNPYLASPDADVVGSGPLPATVALGLLEQAALEASGGQAVMLHVPVSVSWLVGEALHRVGQQMVTSSGSVVVFDAGYPGTGPDGQPAGETVWAYATSPVSVLMSAVRLVDSPAHTVDHVSNTRTVWAEREFIATFDPCVHLATEIAINTGES